MSDSLAIRPSTRNMTSRWPPTPPRKRPCPLRCVRWELNDYEVGHGQYRGGKGGLRKFQFLADGYISSEADGQRHRGSGQPAARQRAGRQHRIRLRRPQRIRKLPGRSEHRLRQWLSQPQSPFARLVGALACGRTSNFLVKEIGLGNQRAGLRQAAAGTARPLGRRLLRRTAGRRRQDLQRPAARPGQQLHLVDPRVGRQSHLPRQLCGTARRRRRRGARGRFRPWLLPLQQAKPADPRDRDQSQEQGARPKNARSTRSSSSSAGSAAAPRRTRGNSTARSSGRATPPSPGWGSRSSPSSRRGSGGRILHAVSGTRGCSVEWLPNLF